MDFLQDSLKELGIETENFIDTASKIVKESEENGLKVEVTDKSNDNTKLKDFCFKLGDDDRMAAVEAAIIPSVYKLAEFSEERIRSYLEWIKHKQEDCVLEIEILC